MENKNNMSAAETVDFYKVDHINQYPKGSESVYSGFTPRSAKLFVNNSEMYDNKVLNFGIQIVVKDYLINFWNDTFFNIPKEEAIEKYKRRMVHSIGEVKLDQWEKLHNLGYLPIVLKSLDEGTRSPIKVPVFTVKETISEFFWLTNYIETALSTEAWKKYTMATTAYEFRRVLEKYAKLTGSPKDFVQFQGHDFSMRGLSSREEAYKNSPAHLTCFMGTDTIPAISGMEDFYNCDASKELIGTSVYASEHSTVTMSIANFINDRHKGTLAVASILPERSAEWKTNEWKSDWQQDLEDAIKEGYKYIHTIDDDCYYEIIDDGCVRSQSKEFCAIRSNMDLDNLTDRQTAEHDVLEYLLTEVYPSGIYSHVSDSYDYWYTLNNTVRSLKDVILERDADTNGFSKLTLRPDSGDPEKIICGLRIRDLAPYLKGDKYDKTLTEINNSANYYINTSYYDGYFYNGETYDFNGELLSDEEVKGSLEILWEIFGGEVNEKGYKVINPKVGLIYGDSITVKREELILKHMKEMGFASCNIIFGIGSYSYSYCTRDTLGFAMKATHGVVNGNSIEIFKDPKTDSGVKKSAKGLMRVIKQDGEYTMYDQQRFVDEDLGELKVRFENGKLYNETSLSKIRENINLEIKKDLEKIDG